MKKRVQEIMDQIDSPLVRAIKERRNDDSCLMKIKRSLIRTSKFCKLDKSYIK